MFNQPYNELGQLLSSGADIAVSIMIAKGWSNDKIVASIQKRFGPLADSDVSFLYDLGQQEFDAGQTMTNAADKTGLAIDGTPINSQLSQETLEGGRTIYTTEVSFDGGDTWIRITVIGDGSESMQDIVDQAMDEAEQIWNKYPDKFGISPGNTVQATDVHILGKVKGF